VILARICPKSRAHPVVAVRFAGVFSKKIKYFFHSRREGYKEYIEQENWPLFCCMQSKKKGIGDEDDN
jgi:hypothetical protein